MSKDLYTEIQTDMSFFKLQGKGCVYYREVPYWRSLDKDASLTGNRIRIISLSEASIKNQTGTSYIVIGSLQRIILHGGNYKPSPKWIDIHREEQIFVIKDIENDVRFGVDKEWIR